MKLSFIKHPRSGVPDPLLTLTCVVTIAAAVKFLLDGVSFEVGGHLISFGHTDAFSFGSLLTPVLGTHGYVNTRVNTSQDLLGSGNVDNPDV